MSQDFVRQLPDAGFSRRRSFIGDALHLDVPLLFLTLILCTYGLIVLYSAVDRQTAMVVSQSIKIGISLGAMLLMAQISPVVYLRFAPWLYLISLGLLFLVLFMGYQVNGSRRWIRIPGVFNFQPSELMKLVLPMILAWYFHDRHLPPRPKHLFWAAIIITLPVLLIAKQPDLGTGLLIGASGILVLFLAGTSWRYVVSVIGIGMVGAPALWLVMRDYQRQRILTVIHWVQAGTSSNRKQP